MKVDSHNSYAFVRRHPSREFAEVCFYISRALILLLAVIQCPSHIKKERKKDRAKNENKHNPFYPW